MEKENRIRLQYCPNCAKMLKTAPDVRKLICPGCEMPVRPVSVCPSGNQKQNDSASAVTDIHAADSWARVFMESYDWSTRTLHKSYTHEQTDALVDRFCRIAAEDALTRQLAFDCIYIPVIRKLQGFPAVLENIASLYATDKTEALSLFNAFQQAVSFMHEQQGHILQQLTTCIKNAQLCHADEAVLADMQKKLQALQALLQELTVPNSAEEIPAIKNALDESNRRLTVQFAEIGIDLEVEYRRIGNFLAQKQFKDAVAALTRFKGYKNTNTLLKDVNRCYRFDEIMQVTGRLYLEKGGNLYAAENGKPAADPCVRGIAQILGTYADRLFYTDSKGKLYCFDLSEKTTAEFDRKRTFPECSPVESDDPTVLYITYRSKDGKGAKVLSRIDPVAFTQTVLYEDTAVIHGIRNNILVYADSKGATYACRLGEDIRYDICSNRIELCEIRENDIVYTRNAPTADNKNLYLYKFSADAKEQLLAANIRSLCCIHGNTACYMVGNRLCSALYAVDLATRETAQIAQSAYRIEHIACDAVYFSIGDTCNRSLCRFDLQSKTRTVLNDSLLKIIGMHCGELLYLDAESNLCSILTDGTNPKILFADVREVLMLRDDKLFFTAADEIQLSRDEAGVASVKELHSLYCITHTGELLRKLAHGIAGAQCFNGKEIDFFKNVPVADGNTTRLLFRYDTKTDDTFKLLEYTAGNKKGK